MFDIKRNRNRKQTQSKANAIENGRKQKKIFQFIPGKERETPLHVTITLLHCWNHQNLLGFEEIFSFFLLCLIRNLIHMDLA